MKGFPKGRPSFRIKKVHSKLLKRVRERIEIQSATYICPTLSVVADELKSEGVKGARKAARALRSHVMTSLSENSYLHHWQINHGINMSSHERRAARVAWLTYLRKK